VNRNSIPALVAVLALLTGVPFQGVQVAEASSCNYGVQSPFLSTQANDVACLDPMNPPPDLCPLFGQVADLVQSAQGTAIDAYGSAGPFGYGNYTAGPLDYGTKPTSSGETATVEACGRTIQVPSELDIVRWADLGTDACEALHATVVTIDGQIPAYPVGYAYGELANATKSFMDEWPPLPPGPSRPVVDLVSQWPTDCPVPYYDGRNADLAVPACVLPPFDAAGVVDGMAWHDQLYNCAAVCSTLPDACQFGLAMQNWAIAVFDGYFDPTNSAFATFQSHRWNMTDEGPLVHQATDEGGNQGAGAANGTTNQVDLTVPQCRIAKATPSNGKWTIAAVTDAPAGASSGAVGGTDVGALTNAGLISFSGGVYVSDNGGNITQEICYNPGPYSEIPNTDPGQTRAAQRAAAYACVGASAAFLVMAAVTAGVAIFGTPAAAWGFFWVTTGAAAAAIAACTTAAIMSEDVGWMHCVGFAYTTWGPANTYSNTLASMGPASLGSFSTGDGREQKNFPWEVDMKGYRKGYEVDCPAAQNAARSAAYDLYLNWGNTTSDPQSGSGMLQLSLSVAPITPIVLGALQPHLQPLGGGLFWETANGALVVGCGQTACPATINIALQSCGQQKILVGSARGHVTYDFNGDPSCATISVNVNGITVTVAVPIEIDANIRGVG
jgi:hypothetical protein